MEYSILGVCIGSDTFGLIIMNAFAYSYTVLRKFYFYGLAAYQKLVICHRNHNIFRSVDVTISVEEEDADFEKSAHEPVT